MKKDVYQIVTDRLISALENGVKPWACPWDRGVGETSLPRNFKTQSFYSGVNIMLLWSAAEEKGFDSPYWLTFKQAKEMGGNVKRGEKGTEIIFYTTWEKEDSDGEIEKIPMLKTFYVFNANQIDGIEFPKSEPQELKEFERLDHVEDLIENTGAKIDHHGVRAFYRIGADEIVLPVRERFNSQADYYATALHELSHWTGHKKRLDRKQINAFGTKDYAFEELVAELGAAFLMADVGITGEVQHESYIASWLKKLNDDKKFIFKAASAASKAHKYIMECGQVMEMAA